MEQITENGISFVKPIFCGTCTSRNSWVRESNRDIHSDDSENKVLYLAWKCRICGAKTISERVNGHL